MSDCTCAACPEHGKDWRTAEIADAEIKLRAAEARVAMERERADKVRADLEAVEKRLAKQVESSRRPRVWFVAVCADCEPEWPLPMPFLDARERNQWADDHMASTGHYVDQGIDIDKRPEFRT